MSDGKIQLLGLSGSIRKGSTNTAILRTLADRVAPKASLDIFPLNDIPLYNGDLEGDLLPARVVALKGAIGSYDGVVICSPEYNYGMSGVIKNALDWASRPGFNSVLKNKPVLIMTSSPGYTGGVRAQTQLLDTLTATLCHVVVRPQVVIAGVMDKIKDGELTDAATLEFTLAAIDDLLVEIGRKRLDKVA